MFWRNLTKGRLYLDQNKSMWMDLGHVNKNKEIAIDIATAWYE